MLPLHFPTVSALCRVLKLVVLNVSWCNAQHVWVVLKQSAFTPEHLVPFLIVYRYNPNYANKKSADSPGIDTVLN